MKLSPLEQNILMNIQLCVICTDMVDFCRPGHNYNYICMHVYLTPRRFPYYFNFIWYLTQHSRRYKKASDLVHQFAMDIITKRRKELEEGVGVAIVGVAYITVLRNLQFIL